MFEISAKDDWSVENSSRKIDGCLLIDWAWGAAFCSGCGDGLIGDGWLYRLDAPQPIFSFDKENKMRHTGQIRLQFGVGRITADLDASTNLWRSGFNGAYVTCIKEINVDRTVRLVYVVEISTGPSESGRIRADVRRNCVTSFDI